MPDTRLIERWLQTVSQAGSPKSQAEDVRFLFAVQVPNATTVKAMKELNEGKGKRFGAAEELFEDIGV